VGGQGEGRLDEGSLGVLLGRVNIEVQGLSGGGEVPLELCYLALDDP